MNTEHRQQKISFWHSMKTQFIAVVILVAAVIVILYTLMIMPGVKSNIRSIYSNYLLDLSISPCGFVPLRQSRRNAQRACRIVPVH